MATMLPAVPSRGPITWKFLDANDQVIYSICSNQLDGLDEINQKWNSSILSIYYYNICNFPPPAEK